MTRLEQIEAQIVELSGEERAKLRAWFDAFEEDEWDRQIREDTTAGRLDHLAEQALRDLDEGRCTEL